MRHVWRIRPRHSHILTPAPDPRAIGAAVTNQPFGHAGVRAHLAVSARLKKYKLHRLSVSSASLSPSLFLSQPKLDLNFNVVAGELVSQAIVGGAALDFDKSCTVCDILKVKFAG